MPLSPLHKIPQYKPGNTNTVTARMDCFVNTTP